MDVKNTSMISFESALTYHPQNAYIEVNGRIKKKGKQFNDCDIFQRKVPYFSTPY